MDVYRNTAKKQCKRRDVSTLGFWCVLVSLNSNSTKTEIANRPIIDSRGVERSVIMHHHSLLTDALLVRTIKLDIDLSLPPLPEGGVKKEVPCVTDFVRDNLEIFIPSSRTNNINMIGETGSIIYLKAFHLNIHIFTQLDYEKYMLVYFC